MTALIDSEGWLTSPLFVRVDGHPAKIYTQPNSGNGGLALHSVVGEEADFLDGVPNRFLSDEREPGDPSRFTLYAAASCMFVLRKRMPHVQMYPVDCSTWTSGGREANTSTWAMEAEGGPVSNPSEPLTPHQVNGVLAIGQAWEAEHGGSLQDGVTVRPHWAIARLLGYAATACESNRYYEARLALARGDQPGEDTMNEDQVRAIAEEVAGGVFLPLMAQLLDINPETFTDDETLAAVRTALRPPGAVANYTEIMARLDLIREAFQRIGDAGVEAIIFSKQATEELPSA